MRIVCIHTKEHSKSTKSARECVNSGKKYGYKVELYPSIYWKNLDEVHKRLNLKRKYKPNHTIRRLTETECPAFRMANGTTHYILYKWCVEHDEPVCILEHDAFFVGKLPDAVPNGVIQVSSHYKSQINGQLLSTCQRAKKMKIHEPNREFVWNDKLKGTILHPLTGTNGTSGYIIHPGAAGKMVDYIETEGVAFADRIRTEWVGEGNLYIQVPQPIICTKEIVRYHKWNDNK